LYYPHLSKNELLVEERKMVKILITDYKDQLFFNNCPKCEKLARTPYAKQCRHCGHDWH